MMLSTRADNFASSSIENEVSLKPTRNASSKTPARSIKHGRAVHDENSVYGHPTGGFTGRKKHNVLFSAPADNSPLKSGLKKTAKTPRFVGKSMALAEITNQTPFNKAPLPLTPGHASLKPSKSFGILKDDTVAASTRRLSSTRKKLRLPRSASKIFQTPETKGNYWDVSDGSIECSTIEDASLTEEDYGDVEYAPPTAIVPQYDPGFDMPNYKEVGATLMSLFRQTTIPGDYDSVSDFYSAELLKDIEPPVWEKLELPEILPDSISSFMTGAHSPVVETPYARSKETQSAPRTTGKNSPQVPSMSCTLKPSTIRPVSKPLTGGVTHTRIPSLSKPKGGQAVTQTLRPTLNSRGTGSGHARTTSVPPKPTIPTHVRTGSVPSRTMSTTHTKLATVSRTMGKPVAKVVSANKWKPEVKSQPSDVTDDTVFAFLTDSANETLDEEFLFEI
ncbi:hypothetical protein JB92DRAFT_3145772 [Gautieria morchelliformis]|nr:hypothetical protein JB92DRAFT_3145772 [Gautieria morchelliformis]